MNGDAVKRALVTWDDVTEAIEELNGPQRELAAELVTRERGETGQDLNADGGSWYVVSASVAGHVGIGQTAVRIPLTPTKGVTVITASNGTGKTSVVDGIRYALSNGQRRPQVELVDENLHWPQRAITVTLANGVQRIDVVCDAAGVRWQEPDGTSRAVPQSWVSAFERYLPVLLYPELSPVIDNPGDLHEFLKGALSLNVLESLLKAVDGVRKKGSEAQRDLGAPWQSAIATTIRSGNSALAEALRKAGATPTPERAVELRALATALPEAVAALPAISPVWTVDAGDVDAIAASVTALEAAREQVVRGAERVQRALDDLLTEGDEYLVARRASDTCPVCASVGAGWVATARAEAQSLRDRLTTVTQARTIAAQALSRLTSSLPPELSRSTVEALRTLQDSEVEARLAEWRQLRTDAARLEADTVATATVQEVARRSGGLAAWYGRSFELIESRRRSELAEHVNVRGAVISWLDAVDGARSAVTRGTTAAALARVVERWIKEARANIFEPIQKEVVRIWSDLNIDADLKLTGVSLGGGVRQARKVEFKITADGGTVLEGAGKAAILSTGQRNALSLAAYLPRATQPGSPFGFLILDDPIHAFDPYRVRYLAEELLRLAETYQVIVFTHDDRLYRELRALGHATTHIRLRRVGGRQSLVTATDATRPGEVLLNEIGTVLDQELDDTLGTAPARVAMTLAMCRQALDTEVTTQIEILGRRTGKSDMEIRSDLQRARTSREQLDLLNRYATAAGLQTLNYSRFQPTITALNDGSHGEAPERVATCKTWVKDSRQLIKSVRRVVDRP